MNALEESAKYFDWDNTHSVRYEGFLVNHTQRKAVDLADYNERSKSFISIKTVYTIDAVPVLTETGGGTEMALFNGVSIDSTEKLAGNWCGDLLQIVAELPEGYEIINCCFAESFNRAQYCYITFGVNEQGYLLNDGKDRLYEAAALNLSGERGVTSNLKVEKTDSKIRYIPVPVR